MKKLYFLFFILLLISSLNAQEQSIQQARPTGINSVSPVWGNDIVVSNFEPIGPISAITANNGTIYVAVNDTLSTSNLGMVIFQSTNNGNTWTLYNYGLSLRVKYNKIKLVKSGTNPDSIYAFVQYLGTIWTWNFRNLTLNSVLQGNYKGFDAVGASSGALYIFLDTIPTAIRRYGSIDGGFTWGNRGSVTASGTGTRLTISPGDTLILNYYGPVQSDTISSVIRAFKYIQTSPGVLTSSGVMDVVSEIIPKPEFMSAYINGTIWIVWSQGTTGSMDIKGRQSVNSGSTYSGIIDIASNPNVDEYWFDLKTFTSGTSGFDIVYYSDSLQAGPPTNGTDKIAYRYSNLSSSTFSSPTYISQHPPFWSDAGYKPAIAELITADFGIVWVGLDGSSKKLFWDRYSAVTNIEPSKEIPSGYALHQNYPNPFNPSTNIKFSIAKEGFVTLKIYDILGRTTAILIEKTMQPGNYTYNFNARNFTSGIYFYKLEVNRFTEIKKMMIQK